MANVNPAEPTPSSKADPTPATSRSTGRRSREMLRRHLDFVVGIVGVIASGIAAVAGSGEVPWVSLLLGGAAVTGVATFVVQALQADEAASKVRSLWIALAFAASVPIGDFVYHQYFDPNTQEPASFELIVQGGDAELHRPVGEPGGHEALVFPPVVGGSHVYVECVVTFREGTSWYRLAADHSFLPASALRPISGLTPPEVPPCE